VHGNNTRNPCLAIFISNWQRCHVFPTIVYVFFFYKIRELEGETGYARRRGGVWRGRGREGRVEQPI
jgi:hypothetical protein